VPQCHVKKVKPISVSQDLLSVLHAYSLKLSHTVEACGVGLRAVQSIDDESKSNCNK